ncbi:excisionase [Paucibacter sp. DJ1R-11]|nr:excisionase [Paucibacter sp. DJ1R-11]MCV2365569.1 excisionase [Paucibacter sp. DJ1R-11]
MNGRLHALQHTTVMPEERRASPPSNDPVFASPLRWIKLPLYCQISGDTPDAVHARRRKQQWFDGVQCKIGPDGNLWINPEEVNKWVENDQHETAAAPHQSLVPVRARSRSRGA